MQRHQPRFVDPAVQQAFTRECEAAREPVWALIRQYRAEEPENVWAEVCSRAWAKFPKMYAEEQAALAALAAGKRGRHNWCSWLLTITNNYLVDQHRHKHGRRWPATESEGESEGESGAECEGNGGAASEVEGGAAAAAGVRNTRIPVFVPLGVEVPSIADGEDPERHVTLREGWRLVNELINALPADERDAVVAMIRGEDDCAVAARWHISERTIRRRRAQGLERLRRRLAGNGYVCAGDLLAA